VLFLIYFFVYLLSTNNNDINNNDINKNLNLLMQLLK
jgi:hypothetical protein